MLYGMAEFLFANDDTTETWFFPLDDDGAGTAAAGTITITGPATENGTIALYIGGRRVPVAVVKNDIADTIAAAITAAINADTNLPVTAAGSTSPVTITARHRGTLGNSLDIRTSYYVGEKVPLGVALTIGAMAGGATDPVLTGIWAILGDAQFDAITWPYVDPTSLAGLDTELASRFTAVRAIESIGVGFKSESHANLASFGAALNSKHLTIEGAKGVPTAPWEVAAAYTGRIAKQSKVDTNLPFVTVPLIGVLAPKESDRFTRSERDILLGKGISTFTVDRSGKVILERAISTYQTTSSGAPDPAWFDLTTILTVSYLRYDFRTMWLQQWAQTKIADDGTRFGAGQKVLTPKSIKGICLTRFRQWEDEGKVEDFEQFKAGLVVERDISDPTRVNILMPVNIVNGLNVVAVSLEFRL